MSKKIIFISGVCGVGKSAICNYINNNKLLNNYVVFDIDDLDNINNYNKDEGNLFYENSIKKALNKSEDKNIIIGSCINTNDYEKINFSKEIESYTSILITCSNEELTKRLKVRDKSRNCSSDEFMEEQMEYQEYLFSNLDLFNLHLDNTNTSIEDIANKIVEYIKRA